MEYSELVPVFLRWAHVTAGIVWIGLLYFFNLVNSPAMKEWDTATRQRVLTTLSPRALWWFRWSAVFTLLLGVLLLHDSALAAGGWRELAGVASGQIILVGALLGLVMFLNVWIVIWPNQRRIIAAARAALATQTPAPPEQAAWARRAFLASRTNLVLSLPMLALMVSASHLGELLPALGFAAVAAAGGLVWVWELGRPTKPPAAPATK